MRSIRYCASDSGSTVRRRFKWSGQRRNPNNGFASAFGSAHLFRFVYCFDAVTLLPPRRLGYRHVGTEWFITSGQDLLVAPSDRILHLEKGRGYLKYFRKLPWLKPGVLALRSLADHIIVNYTHAIWANLPAGTRNADE